MKKESESEDSEWIGQGSGTAVSTIKCKPGQDEVFDNCVKVEEAD